VLLYIQLTHLQKSSVCGGVKYKFFDNKVSSITMDRISHNLYESCVLATIRDTLLPTEKFIEVVL